MRVRLLTLVKTVRRQAPGLEHEGSPPAQATNPHRLAI
jgi:hypothetical protein